MRRSTQVSQKSIIAIFGQNEHTAVPLSLLYSVVS